MPAGWYVTSRASIATRKQAPSVGWPPVWQAAPLYQRGPPRPDRGSGERGADRFGRSRAYRAQRGARAGGAATASGTVGVSPRGAGPLHPVLRPPPVLRLPGPAGPTALPL